MAVQTIKKTFTGVEDSLAAVWAASLSGAQGVALGVTITDSAGPIFAWLENVTSTGADVYVSDRFSGTVNLMVFDVV